jgi:hypothetical protein
MELLLWWLSVCGNDKYGGDMQDILNNNEHMSIT